MTIFPLSSQESTWQLCVIFSLDHHFARGKPIATKALCHSLRPPRLCAARFHYPLSVPLRGVLDTMVLTSASSLDVGGDAVVGASWGSRDALLVTTSHAVRVFQVSSQSCARSWISRPGAATAFTSACVRCRSDGALYAVQGGKTVVSWDWSEDNLANAKATELPAEVFTLQLSSSRTAAVAVCTDGSVHAFYNGTKVVSASPAGKLEPVTWAQVTKLKSGAGTGADSAVLVLHGNTKKKTGPTLSVWKVVVRGNASGSTATTLVRHTLPRREVSAGATDTATDTVAGGAYHPKLQLLSIVWASGQWQELQFSDAGLLTTPKARPGRRLELTTSTPEQGKARRSKKRTADSHAQALVASPMGRSAVVVAGAVAGNASADAPASVSGSAGVVVWDVNYGAVLGSAATELSLSHGMVGVWHSFDGTHIAVATAAGVAVAALESAEGSLAAALGRHAATAMFEAGGTDATACHVLAPTVDVRACLPATAETASDGSEEADAAAAKRASKKRRRGAKDTASAGAGAGAGAGARAGANVTPGALSGEQLSSWSQSTAKANAEEAAAIAQLCSKSDTPNAKSFKKVFDAYVGSTTGASQRKRKRGSAAASPATAAAPSGFAPSHAFLTAVVGRIVSEPKLDLWAPLCQLLGTRKVSASACPGLVPFVMAQQNLEVLELCLRKVTDIPETMLVAVLRFVFAHANKGHMSEFVSAKHRSAKQKAWRGDEAVCAGVEHFVFMVMRTRINDVLMQAALKQLTTSEAALLIAVLKRVLHAYWIHYLDVHTPRRRGDAKGDEVADGEAVDDLTAALLHVETGSFRGATPASKVPSLAQTLEWTHLVVDAQFTSFAVQSLNDTRVINMLKVRWIAVLC